MKKILTSLLTVFVLVSSALAEDIQIYNNDHFNRIVIQNNIGATGDSSLFFGASLAASLQFDNANNLFIFSDDVDFQNNEIKNVRLENLATAPTCDSSFLGKIYHNTTDTFSYICDGTDWDRIDEEASSTGEKLQPYFYTISPDKLGIDETKDIIVTGGNFDENTVFTVGAGVTVNSVTINSDKLATLNITAGSVETFDIPVDAKNDTLDDFGATLTLDVVIDNWTLFAITSSTQCAESLPYGTNAITESSNAYFSTLDQDVTSSQFKQVFTVDGNELFEILYDFGNTKTLKERFNNATVSGESVNWTVTENGIDYNYGPYLFYYSDGAALSTKWDGASGTKFANDDGVWGAGPNNIDGNGGPYDTWGHGNRNSSDSSWCNKYHINGTEYTSSGIKSYMYMQ